MCSCRIYMLAPFLLCYMCIKHVAQMAMACHNATDTVGKRASVEQRTEAGQCRRADRSRLEEKRMRGCLRIVARKLLVRQSKTVAHQHGGPDNGSFTECDPA